MSPNTLPNGNIMRKSPSSFLAKLSAFLLLSVVAIGQTVEPTKNETTEAKRTNEEVVKGLESAGFFQKLGEFVDLSKRLEGLSKVVERLEAMEAKIGKMQPNDLQQPAPAAAPTTQVVSPPEPPSVTPSPAVPAWPMVPAERVSVDSFGLVGGGNDAVGHADEVPMPFLNENTPEWVKNGLRNGHAIGDERNFVISSSLLPDLEQCHEDLKSRMMSEIRAYLKKNILEFEDAKLTQLTQEYVEKYWVKRDQLFDNVQDRPSGTYHQVWIGLHISTEQLAKIKSWEKQSERDLRVKKVGIVGGISVFAVTFLSGAVGLLARREKAKLKG